MDKENKKIFVNGKQLECLICGGTHFTIGKSLLNTRGMAFLNLEWANSEAINYICEECGYILWFMETPNQYFEEDFNETQSEVDEIGVDCEESVANEIAEDYEKNIANENECPNCFSVINKGDTECANCGYKLKE